MIRLILLLLLTSNISFGQNERISYIRQQYKEINASINSYKINESLDINVYKDLNPNQYSYESTRIYRLAMINMVRYFRKNTLVKIELTFDGSRQNLISEYYFDENGLLFVFQQQTDFEEPKSSESFDEKQNTVRENRYYFDYGKLIRWIDESGITKELRTNQFKDCEKQVISDALLYKNYIEEQ